jgi:beta-glucosidase-like glycosyl hydrolase/CubicO group peptidase (beta-lactamase class C family)
MQPDPMAVLPATGVTGATTKISVDSILGTLSIRAKVGQLVMPWRLGNYASYESEEYDTLALWIDSLAVGGVIISTGRPLEVAAKLNAMQRRSRLPLLVAADLEWGTGMRLAGGTAFPAPMALGATARESDAYELGRVTALEARAVGIHLSFSPVADVNSNPANPIINTRSFGEDAHRAARMVSAYVRGARDQGLMTTAKHFPGHGDTDLDSHIALPVVHRCWGELDTLDLVPFRAAIEVGVTAVMTAHLALPCLNDPDDTPATLSSRVMEEILRDSLGFTGLVVTDALDMGALVGRYGAGETAVRALLAGSDMLLMPSHLTEAVDAVVRAVQSGRLPEERLDRSVRRVLELKRRAGLFERRTVPLDRVPDVVGHRAFRAIAADVARRSLTLVWAGPVASYRATRGRLAMIVYAGEGDVSLGGALNRELRTLGDTASVFRLYPASGPASYDSARTMIERHDRVVAVTSVRVSSGSGRIDLPTAVANLITEIGDKRATILVSLGSPYLLAQLPDFLGGYLLAWSSVEVSEIAVAQALAGGAPITGKLPITLPGVAEIGDGVIVGVDAGGGGGDEPDGRLIDSFADLDRYLAAEVAAGAFPGGVLWVGHRGRPAHVAAFGTLGVDDPRPVTPETVYDLASLTKVVGLTTAVMMLVAEGVMDLDGRVADYLPEFAAGDKGRVTLRHLLTHTSGLAPWRPLYRETATPDGALAIVMAERLGAPPGTRYAYSDLGAIALGKAVERVTGESLDEWLATRLFDPLDMRRTRFRPPQDWLSDIAPTELDPWRGRMLLGEVHDENAARLGGVAGHAGLFSNAPDLARFLTWLLDAYHDRLDAQASPALPAAIVRGFTRRQPGPDGSTRALGWDTPSLSGAGSSGSLISPAGFGHTGFTGTSIWVDPERDLFVVLLTNRVHPTRANGAIAAVRRNVADAVIRVIDAAEPSR